ncbi:MAG: 1-deoxy-D-xylulose-5-phosphate reductoisomerase [Muribaculaceae bacterium]|nr:1-deoxy-D-xylulose-5-phosphate reductoisomerase [Muribaculaceae bacterium]MDE6611916.1 1-deoxy-D-xylulose-5-phosphate reductoisomerase [Muribaculaceae bacterium]
MTKGIAVLGATGSIGRQALDIIENHPDRYKAVVLAAGRRVDELIELARLHRPSLAVIDDETLLPRLRDALAPLGIDTAAGAKALADCVDMPEVDMVLTATVGYSGLAPTVRAIKAGKDIALANKETLVVAGNLVNSLLRESGSRLFPVDSEHSAIAQCLQGEDPATVERLLITASGGPFRTWPSERIASATAADALKHPNWSMGAKITIDSATMLNKAFEIIEAHHLFGVAPERIEAVVHPQSIVHSMVEFADGAVKAQLGLPDMHLPIAYALGEDTRLAGAEKRLSLADYATLTFEKPDETRFPCLSLARHCLSKGGTAACTVNAANEVAVAAFLKGEIRFGDIYRVIADVLSQTSFVSAPSYDDYVAVNDEARDRAVALINALNA